LHSLTDREREVLRLLAGGHDVKSIARELSISTSAVTDRLRYARRKLGVSTSREAARLLANDESTARFGVHMFSGEESPADPMQQKRSKRFVGMGIAMLILIAAVATYFSVVHVGNPTQNPRAQVALRSNGPEIGPGSKPVKVVVAEDPRKYCGGHPVTHLQGGSGFTLQCAGHSPHQRSVGLRPIPHTTARATLVQ
jgi:DNA-binding CsgD family transcriptional regulator